MPFRASLNQQSCQGDGNARNADAEADTQCDRVCRQMASCCLLVGPGVLFHLAIDYRCQCSEMMPTIVELTFNNQQFADRNAQVSLGLRNQHIYIRLELASKPSLGIHTGKVKQILQQD